MSIIPIARVLVDYFADYRAVFGYPALVERRLYEAPNTTMLGIGADHQSVTTQITQGIYDRSTFVEYPIVKQYLFGQLGIANYHRVDRAEPDSN
ncbi:hypothetical protein V7968_02405 [Nocardia vulneris]